MRTNSNMQSPHTINTDFLCSIDRSTNHFSLSTLYFIKLSLFQFSLRHQIREHVIKCTIHLWLRSHKQKFNMSYRSTQQNLSNVKSIEIDATLCFIIFYSQMNYNRNKLTQIKLVKVKMNIVQIDMCVYL